MPELMIVCQGQWRAGPMNRIIFQPDGTRMYPIFSPRRRLYEELYELEATIPIARLRGSRQVVSEAN